MSNTALYFTGKVCENVNANSKCGLQAKHTRTGHNTRQHITGKLCTALRHQGELENDRFDHKCYCSVFSVCNISVALCSPMQRAHVQMHCCCYAAVRERLCSAAGEVAHYSAVGSREKQEGHK
jgi:hypothetical protein